MGIKEALDNPGVDPRLTSKSLAASRMLRVLMEVFRASLGEEQPQMRTIEHLKATSKNIGSPWRWRLRLMSQPIPALAGSRAGAILRGALKRRNQSPQLPIHLQSVHFEQNRLAGSLTGLVIQIFLGLSRASFSYQATSILLACPHG
jgi:hypothetical protein